MAKMMCQQHLLVFLLVCPAFLHGTPLAADPAAVAADPAAAAVPVAASPVVEAAPAPVAAAVEPVSGTKAIPDASTLGGGIITEQKNPDGSTITITRYNGPLPASAFTPLTSGLTGLHNSIYDNYYQTQLVQQALLRNMQQAFSYNYAPYVSVPTVLPYYRTSAYLPYVSYSSGPFYSPFFGGYGGYPGFYPGFGHPYGKSA